MIPRPSSLIVFPLFTPGQCGLLVVRSALQSHGKGRYWTRCLSCAGEAIRTVAAIYGAPRACRTCCSPRGGIYPTRNGFQVFWGRQYIGSFATRKDAVFARLVVKKYTEAP